MFLANRTNQEATYGESQSKTWESKKRDRKAECGWRERGWLRVMHAENTTHQH